MPFKVKLQRYLPQHGLSRCLGKLAQLERPPALKNWLIRTFIKRYHVDMTEAAQSDPTLYKNFNDFFTRVLRPDARQIQLNNTQFLSPADGVISAIGSIEKDTLVQAKGHNYTLDELLAGDKSASDAFNNGHFLTLYLAPKDYHRVHMPITGTLKRMIYVPGKLFSVNTLTTAHIPKLFALNERVICHFATTYGDMTIILVGAMIVASIATHWAGVVAPSTGKPQTWTYDGSLTLMQGDEMGHFQLGSTVIVLLPPALQATWSATVEQSVQLGQPLAKDIYANFF